MRQITKNLTKWLGFEDRLNKQPKLRRFYRPILEKMEERLAPATVVSPGNMNNWAFDVRDSGGNLNNNPTAGGQFVTGPFTVPIGSGSARLFTGNGTVGGDGGAELRNDSYAGVLLSSLTALSYDTYATQWNGQQLPYIVLEVDWDGDLTPDDRLFFEPAYQTPSSGNPLLPNQGSEMLNTWQHWDALAGGWWANSNIVTPGTGVDSLAYYTSIQPNARIVNTLSGLGGVQLRVGFASAGDQFNGYVDNFTIGTGSSTTYDFENIAPTTVYVNPAWAGTNLGVDPDGAGPATVFGGDAFTTIQAGVNAVATGGTVNVAAGTYAEVVDLNKALTLSGANAGLTAQGATNRALRGPATIIQPVSTGDPVGARIYASNVTIDGFDFLGAGTLAGAYNQVEVYASDATVKNSIFNSQLNSPFQPFGANTIGIVTGIGTNFNNLLIEDSFFARQRNGIFLNPTNSVVSVTVQDSEFASRTGFNSDISNSGYNWQSGTLFTITGNTAGLTTVDSLPFGPVTGFNIGEITSGMTVNVGNNSIGTNSQGVRFASILSGGIASVTGNIFTDHTDPATGLRVNAATGSTITVTGNSFKNALFVDNQGAQGFNLASNAADLGLGGFLLSSATVSQFYDVADRVWDAVDVATRGYVALQAGNVYVTPNSFVTPTTVANIQRAIDVATTGDTVHIKGGSYTGNVSSAGKAITYDIGASPAQVTQSGDFILDSADTYKVEINGPAAGTGFDQLIVTSGNVNLGGATLNLLIGYVPASGDSPFLLIDKQSAGAISGTFASPPTGSGWVTYTPPGPPDGIDRIQVPSATPPTNLIYDLRKDGGNGNDFVMKLSPNTLPTTTPPTPAPAAEDAVSFPIVLTASDLETAASALTFTITSLPSRGTLFYEVTPGSGVWVPIPLGGQITGSPANLRYLPGGCADGNATPNNDSFNYAVTDTPFNGNPANTVNATVNLSITAPTRTALVETAHDDLYGLGAAPNVIYVRGTAGNDNIVVTKSGTNYVIKNGLTTIGTVPVAGIAAVRIFGLNGNDTLDVSSATLTPAIQSLLVGGAGIDTLKGGAGIDVIYGRDGADLIYGNGGDDFLHGCGGADSIWGGEGADQIYGGGDNDVIRGENGNDHLFGGLGTDNVIGGNGDDRVYIQGTEGEFDTITAGADAGTTDYLILLANTGDATLNYFLRSENGIDQVLGNGQGIFGNANNNTLNFTGVTFIGVAFVDGAAGNDAITGTAGNDVLRGGAGNDVLRGGLGDDTLDGGLGNDTLYGEGGSNKFVLDISDSTGEDVIFDFQDGIDKIRLVGYGTPPYSLPVVTIGTIPPVGAAGQISKWQQFADAMFILPGVNKKARLKNFSAVNLTTADFEFA